MVMLSDKHAAMVIIGVKNKVGAYIDCNNNFLRCSPFSDLEHLYGKTDFDFFPEDYALDFSNHDEFAKKNFEWSGMERTVFPQIGECIALSRKWVVTDDGGRYGKGTIIFESQLIKVSALSRVLLTDRASLQASDTKNAYEFVCDLPLSQRELQILYFIVRGKTAKEIGRLMAISPRTVETHTVNIKLKMGCDTKSQLIEKAHAERFIDYIPFSLVAPYIEG